MGLERKGKKKIPISKLRRIVLLGIIVLFLLQFWRIKVLLGGLSGSLALWFVKLIDVFAYFESLVAAKKFAITALWSLVPVAVIYLVFGRAFCGWVCPMDFLFEVVDKIKVRTSGSGIEVQNGKTLKLSPKLGYLVVFFLLLTSALIEVPFFTNYFSHLTNFFRFLSGTVFFALNMPLEMTVLVYSGGIIILLLGFEYFFPRVWCRILCPVGKVYGLFNKVSLLKLKFVEGECGGCNLCERMCYMNVKITENLSRSELRDTNCIYCGRCVEGCETKGRIIKFTLKR